MLENQMYRRSLLVQVLALVAIVFIACGSALAEPPKATPTVTALPTSTLLIGIITESPETWF